MENGAYSERLAYCFWDPVNDSFIVVSGIYWSLTGHNCIVIVVLFNSYPTILLRENSRLLWQVVILCYDKVVILCSNWSFNIILKNSIKNWWNHIYCATNWILKNGTWSCYFLITLYISKIYVSYYRI